MIRDETIWSVTCINKVSKYFRNRCHLFLKAHRIVEDLFGALVHVLALFRTYQQVDRRHPGTRPEELLDKQLAHEAGATGDKNTLAMVELLDRRQLLVDRRIFRRRFWPAVWLDDGHLLTIDSILQEHLHHLFYGLAPTREESLAIGTIHLISNSYSRFGVLRAVASNLKVILPFSPSQSISKFALRLASLIITYTWTWRILERQHHPRDRWIRDG